VWPSATASEPPGGAPGRQADGSYDAPLMTNFPPMLTLLSRRANFSVTF
jgi:hypothetical protein